MITDMRPSYLRAFFLTGLMAATLLIAGSAGPTSPSQPTLPAQKAQIARDYGKLPFSFEANTGQADQRVKFLARGSGYGLYLTGDEAVLTLKTGRQNAKGKSQKAKVKSPAKGGVFRMKLVGANTRAEVAGAEELPGKANYFIGNNPRKWRTNIPTYAKVKYRGVYPGVDLVYYGNQGGQLEYDFVIAPGANPTAIRFALSGGLKEGSGQSAVGRETQGLTQRQSKIQNLKSKIDANGDLVVETAVGPIRFRKPVVYQEAESGVRGPESEAQDETRNPKLEIGATGNRQLTVITRHSSLATRHFVAGRFTLDAQNHVRFALGAYNHAQPLVIDPVLVYSTYLGGSGTDEADAITVDAAGNAYVAGRTTSLNFPVTPGAVQTSNSAAANNSFTAFVSKLNPTGTALVYSTYLGGSGTQSGSGDRASGLVVDSFGNAYVTGSTGSIDFPVTPGAFQATNKAAANGLTNAFITEINPTGTALVYSTYLGGSGGIDAYGESFGDQGSGLAIDGSGNAYVTGEAVSSDFPVTPGAFLTTSPGQAAFVTKLNPTGTALVYSTFLGVTGSKTALAVDDSGSAYIVGGTDSTSFPVTPGAFQTTNHAAGKSFGNGFVTKLNPAGSALVYSTYLGGSGNGECCGSDLASGVAVDGAGNAYVTGSAQSTDFPVTPGAFQTTNHGAAHGFTNAFVTKLNPAGTALVYSTYLGGSGGIINLSPTLELATGDMASGLAIDSSGNAYVAGITPSSDFPVTPGAYQTTNNDQCESGCIGGYNAFITELDSTGSALVYSTYLGGDGINPGDFVGIIAFGEGDQASALALDNSGNVYVTGSATSYDFPVTGGAFQTTIQVRATNAFITKMDLTATSTTTTPTVTVTPAASTITSAKGLTVTISMSGGSGSPTPTGTVTLVSGTYASAATTLSGGSATISIPAGSLLAAPAGYPSPDVLTARYIPDTASSSTYNFATGLASVNVVAPYIAVTPSSSTLTWAESQSQALTVAMVATGGTGNPVPTGMVTLTTGSYTSAATALTGGSATITIPAATLTTGFNTLNVSYSGDSNYLAVGVAGSALVTVGAVSVTVVPSASSINAGQALPVTITVSAGSSSPLATGKVTLICGSYTSPTTALANGSATITIPAGTLAPGVDTLTVDYGNGNYAGATGGASVTVTSGSPAFSITGTAVTVTAGATSGNTSTITVTPAGGFTGSVGLSAAITSSLTGVNDPPTLSFGSTSPVNITGAKAGTATLTFSTTAPGGCVEGNLIHHGVPWYPAGGAALACLLLLFLPVRRMNWRPRLGALVLLAILAGGMAACGTSERINCTAITSGTTAGTYTITVTGTAGPTTGTGTLTLTVQ